MARKKVSADLGRALEHFAGVPKSKKKEARALKKEMEAKAGYD